MDSIRRPLPTIDHVRYVLLIELAFVFTSSGSYDCCGCCRWGEHLFNVHRVPQQSYCSVVPSALLLRREFLCTNKPNEDGAEYGSLSLLSLRPLASAIQLVRCLR
eukprot:4917439-Amphidinium_carterae.2